MQDTTGIHLILSCQKQSGSAKQLGFRLPSDEEIRRFGRSIGHPSSRHGYPIFNLWERGLDQCLCDTPYRPYTREIWIYGATWCVPAHLTIARAAKGKSQGWITARKGTRARDFVAGNLGRKLSCIYIPQLHEDLLLLPDAVSREIRFAA